LSRDTNFSSSSSSFSQSLFLLQWRDDFFFVKEEKLPFFDSSREKKKRKDRRLLRQNNKRSLQKPLVLSLLSPVVRAPAVVRRNAALFLFPDAAADKQRAAGD